MMCFGLGLVTEDTRLLRSARTLAGALTHPAQAGSVISIRRVIRGPQSWDHLPRTIAIVALDSGAWCFAWIVGGNSVTGARARLLGHVPGATYPTFTTEQTR